MKLLQTFQVTVNESCLKAAQRALRKADDNYIISTNCVVFQALRRKFRRPQIGMGFAAARFDYSNMIAEYECLAAKSLTLMAGRDNTLNHPERIRAVLPQTLTFTLLKAEKR